VASRSISLLFRAANFQIFLLLLNLFLKKIVSQRQTQEFFRTIKRTNLKAKMYIKTAI
jgi:hypothetical protein